MRDTSTDNYFQEVAQTNQGLLDGGVTAIKLVNVEWGAISVNGNKATAENFETWATTYSDGSNDQSRDRNVYSLVQQNGAWKIDGDDQPGGGQPSASTAPRPATSAAPRPSGRGNGNGNGSGRGRPSASPSPAASAPAGASTLTIGAAAGSAEAAVQQVVLKGNAEQEQAIAAKDSSGMKDTSTDSYYQDLAQTNQDMLDSGVTAIRLVNIEWGATTVNGGSATVNTFETWWTQYSDGSTDQARDRNVYTLVQQNGAWKVQSDDHPDNGFTTVPGGSQPGRPAASAIPRPSAPAPGALPARARGQSSNWSGYAASGGKYTSVTGTWTVPQPSATGTLGADAAWVGIGGENSRDLIQAGTEETVLSSGTIHYDAWIEMLPQYSHPIPLAVHPGDSITVGIDQQPDGSWKIAFKNNTTTNTYERTVQYTSTLSSAEWIEEAPSGGRGGIMPLDNFGSITFSDASAVKDGQKVNLSQAGAQPITMINGNRDPLVTAAAIGGDGSSFTLTRTDNVSTSRGGGGFPRGRTS
jgi:hypothetical protein